MNPVFTNVFYITGQRISLAREGGKGTWTSAMTLIDGSTLANSSIAMMAVVKEASVPPYSCGISIAMSYVDVSP